MTRSGAGAMVRAYIGLGSNLDDPAAHVRAALAELDALPDTRVSARSGLYRSPPMGPPDQPDYVNAVAGVDTRLEPEALLDHLQGIEQRHGRMRARRWGERTLDLDLLLYADAVIATGRLTVPHPGLHERAFVLYPLLEIAPGLEVPRQGRIEELAARCPREGLERLEEGT